MYLVQITRCLIKKVGEVGELAELTKKGARGLSFHSVGSRPVSCKKCHRLAFIDAGEVIADGQPQSRASDNDLIRGICDDERLPPVTKPHLYSPRPELCGASHTGERRVGKRAQQPS